MFNLFDQKAYSSEFYYATAITKSGTAGIDDYQVHPLEPLSARLTVTVTF